jgi:hypothetical protein
MGKSGTFWVTVVMAVVLASILYALSRYALRRFKFSKRDLKAAGLNRRERRQFTARRKGAQGSGKKRF